VNEDVSPDNIWENGSRAANRLGGRHSRCNVKISCPACAAKYSIADEKVQDKLAKIRCRKCGTTIVIDGKVSPPNVFAGEASQVDSPQVAAASSSVAADAGGGGAGEYSVDFGDNDQRSMSLGDLVAAYNNGTVTTETFVWADGMDDWQPLGQVPAIVDALNGAAAPAPAYAAPAATPFQPPATPAAPPWEPKPVESPSAIRAAAKIGGGRGSTSDLFGAYETAGSEQDVTTSAREPSVGSNAGAGASVGATGARNESSVLFSLSALTASAPAAKPAASASSASSAISFGGGSTTTKEDSGLIDLKALTAASEPQAPSPILAPAPLGMAPPLGLAPPMGGVEAQYPVPQQKSKTGLFIGGGIAVAAVAIAIAIVMTSQKPPPPAPPPAVATPAPTPTPTPEATQASTAKAPATGTTEEKPPEDGKTASKKPVGGGRPYTGKKPSGGETTTSKPAGEKKPPAAAKNPCGCASGDLQCAMKCAAGGG
jgi:predicted Zn finger-like uncharacterized protein